MKNTGLPETQERLNHNGCVSPPIQTSFNPSICAHCGNLETLEILVNGIPCCINCLRDLPTDILTGRAAQKGG